MEFIFWFKILSPHQMPYISMLANMGHFVTVISEVVISEDRAKLGWTVPEVGKATVKLNPSEIEIEEIIKKSGKKAVHLIGELRFEARGKAIIRHFKKYSSRFGIVTESPDSRGFKGALRRTKYILERYLQGRRFDFILAMGKKGVNWFTQCGYANSKVFEFAYVVDDSNSMNAKKTRFSGWENSPFRLLYVGRLIPLKRVDLLIRSIAKIKESFLLEIVGSGVEKERLKKLSGQLGLEKQITWTDSVSYGIVREKMACSDALVLPSHHDGWGAVIGEALQSGTPVICSNACGASCLIESDKLGAVFAAQNLSELRKVIVSRIRKGKQSQKEREILKSYSRESHGSAAVAKYFELVMQHIYDQKPRPSKIGDRSIQS